MKLSGLILTGVSDARMEKRAECFVVRQVAFLDELIGGSDLEGWLRSEGLGVLRELDQQ